MKIKALVTTDAPILRPNEPIVGAVKTLSETTLGVLPVVETDGSLVGVLRPRDVLPILLGRSTRGRQVHHFMERRFVTFCETDMVAEAASHWACGERDELIVLDSDGRLVGLLERHPVLRMIPRLRRAA